MLENTLSGEAGAQAGGHIDWTKYSIGTAMQQLRSHNPSVVKQTLRLLHIRWYHVGVARMSNILRSAGVSEEAIKMIPGTIYTCRVCRAFRRPTPHSVTTSRLPTSFNEIVHHDFLFLTVHKASTILLWVWWAAQCLWQMAYNVTT